MIISTIKSYSLSQNKCMLNNMLLNIEPISYLPMCLLFTPLNLLVFIYHLGFIYIVITQQVYTHS